MNKLEILLDAILDLPECKGRRALLQAQEMVRDYLIEDYDDELAAYESKVFKADRYELETYEDEVLKADRYETVDKPVVNKGKK